MVPESQKADMTVNGDGERRHMVMHCTGTTRRRHEQELIEEEPLLIRVEGRPYSVVMRTPGEEIFHVAGFCLSEGLVDGPDDFAVIGCCDQKNTNVATVTLQPERREEVEPLLKRRGFISQTSCGICGKEVMEDLCQILVPSEDKRRISLGRALDCVTRLYGRQRLYTKTRGSHAAILFDSRFGVLAFSEDVGRHNALDKAIGKALLNGGLPEALLGIVSSRMSYEMVQKAARAHLPIMIGLSRPTALAVKLGRALNMTLACAKDENCLLVFCGEDRIVGA